MVGDMILVVDDNPKVKQSVELALERYHVVGLPSAEEALEFLKKPHDADLVILDVNLAGMSGLDALSEIKKNQPKLPAIILTAFGTSDVILKALRAHADDYLDKPFNPRELLNKVESLLEKRDRDEEGLRYTDRVIRRVTRLVTRNYHKKVSLKDASAVASLSPKYLSRLFREKTGRRFTEYRIGLIVEKAKELLNASSHDVGQISQNLGYENPEAFMKMFKKTTGMTPSEYRRRNPVSLRAVVSQPTGF